MESLTLTPQSNCLHGLILHERVDANALNKLIHSSLLKENVSKWKQQCYTSEKQQLIKYASLIKNGTATVQYCKADGTSWGRCNPKNMASLFTIRKEIRHTISGDYYTDIDMVNCHPTILYQICKLFDIPCKSLEDYVTNRQKYIDMVTSFYKVDYDDAKKLFIRILYGGGFKKWAEDTGVILEAKEFIADFIKEFQLIAKIITEANPLIRQSVIERKEKKGQQYYNLDGATIAVFLQEIEVRILEQIYIYLHDNKYLHGKSLVLCADGVMIETSEFKNDLLPKLSELVQAKFGFTLEFCTKPMDKSFKKEDINECLIFDLHRPEFTTGLLSDYFKILFDNFIYKDNKIYFFNGIYWQEDSGFIKLINHIDNRFYRDLLHYYCKKREVLIKSEVLLLTEVQREENKKELASLEKFHKNINLYCVKLSSKRI